MINSVNSRDEFEVNHADHKILDIITQLKSRYTMNQLTAISPLDGRYLKKLSKLNEFSSEYGLLKYRLKVEIYWLKFLFMQKALNLPSLSNLEIQLLDNILAEFNLTEAQKIKDLEQITNHDVKALEYYIKEKIKANKLLQQYKEMVHFACTSEDINNTSYALMLKDLVNLVLSKLDEIMQGLESRAHEYKEAAMMSRTHGQAASPTTMGKELYNVYYRIKRQVTQLQNQEYLAKMNGAVGNYNAHLIAYPDIAWNELAYEFITQDLGLDFNPYTTQIEPHDYQAEIFDNLRRINTILIDLARDIWTYISLNYFTQALNSGEIGSSTMPHKVNPIDFENAEGNFGLSNALLIHLAEKLPISRLQRDLTDSTVQRNIGVAFGYMLLGLNSLSKGLNKLKINLSRLNEDLENNWELLAEAIQTVMRKLAISDAYEMLKHLTRGNKIDSIKLREFINNLSIDSAEKERLLKLSPHNYIGLASRLF